MCGRSSSPRASKPSPAAANGVPAELRKGKRQTGQSGLGKLCPLSCRISDATGKGALPKQPHPASQCSRVRYATGNPVLLEGLLGWELATHVMPLPENFTSLDIETQKLR